MEIEEYNGTLAYNVGDQCWIYNYLAEYNTEVPDQKLYFICIKKHELNSYHSPVIPSYFPNDPNYPKWLEDKSWEMIWPEWKQDGVYGNGHFVTYNGYYYQNSWRFVRIRNDENPNDPQNERILNNELPPNENEDEDNVRPWIYSAPRYTDPSFGLFSYHLERQFHDEIYDVRIPHPYYNGYYGTAEIDGSAQSSGIGFGYRRHGVSMEVYQDYDDFYGLETDNEGQFIDQNNDNTIDADDNVLVLDGGIAEAQVCGVALQHRWSGGMCWGLGITAVNPEVNPPYGQTTLWYWVGSSSGSPDGSVPPTITEYKEYNAKGLVFYNFNHPMFFRRQVKVTIGIRTSKNWWEPVKDVAGNVVGWTVKGKWSAYKVEKTFTPVDDCFSNLEVPFGYFPCLPDENVVGKFMLPMGEMRRSEAFAYNQKWTPFFPYVKIERDD